MACDCATTPPEKGQTDQPHGRALVNRDNFPTSWAEEQVGKYVQDSVKISVLHVIVPTTKVLTPVYNLFIFHPTRNPDSLLQWRRWIAKLSFFAGEYGVGERYEYMFNCVHCKSVDHPGGLCLYTKGANNSRMDDSDSDDDLLPKKGKAPQKPKPSARDGKPDCSKGKGRATGPPKTNKSHWGQVLVSWVGKL